MDGLPKNVVDIWSMLNEGNDETEKTPVKPVRALHYLDPPLYEDRRLRRLYDAYTDGVCRVPKSTFRKPEVAYTDVSCDGTEYGILCDVPPATSGTVEQVQWQWWRRGRDEK